MILEMDWISYRMGNSVLEHCFQAWACKDLLTGGALLHLDHKLNKASYTSATRATLRSRTSKEGHIDPQI